MLFYHSGGKFSVVVTTFLWGWWAGSGGVLSNFAFRFNLRFCCLQICSDCGLYQESIDINSANHYPRSLYGERLFRNDPFRLPITFSTHAPHAGSDFITWAPPAARKHFYPRSPCGERHGGTGGGVTPEHFYPRSPCGRSLPVSVEHL